MHAKALEIAWHDASPIWSVDVSQTNRVVTAGGDKVARVWRLNPRLAAAPPPPRGPGPTAKDPSADAAPVDWLCDLRAHLTTVNVARFNRAGLAIATGADQGEIVVWRLSADAAPASSPLEAAEAAASGEAEAAPRERWAREVTLRGHVQDVLDLSWAADGLTLASASVDNSVMIWDVRNPTRPPVTMRAHSNFVQGVAIDPLGKIVTSLGNDRTFRVFSRAGQSPWVQVGSLTSITADARLFQDDTKFQTFFRRLAWSPDGSVVACPSGLHFPQMKRMFAVHLFARFQWSQPAAQCGGMLSPACAVRFSPVLYALRKDACSEDLVATEQAHSSTASQSSNKTGEGDSSEGHIDIATPRRNIGPFEGFSYRMIFAVACTDSVLFYDTEVFNRPFAKVEGLHCAEHTDISWTPDGLHVVVSSVDGYASIISFTEEELGTPLREDQMPRWLREYSLSKQQHSDTKVLTKATRVIAPVPARHAMLPKPCHPTLSKTDSMKDLEPSRRSNSPAKAVEESHVREASQPLPSESNIGKTVLATLSVEADVNRTAAVTQGNTSGQGFRISPVQPTNASRRREVPGTKAVTMDLSQFADVGSKHDGFERQHGCRGLAKSLVSGSKQEPSRNADVTVVVPKRCPKPESNVQSANFLQPQLAVKSEHAGSSASTVPVRARPLFEAVTAAQRRLATKSEHAGLSVLCPPANAEALVEKDESSLKKPATKSELATMGKLAGLTTSSVPVGTRSPAKDSPRQRKLATKSELAELSSSSSPACTGSLIKRVSPPQGKMATKSELTGLSASSAPLGTGSLAKVPPPQRKLATKSELAELSASRAAVGIGSITKKTSPPQRKLATKSEMIVFSASSAPLRKSTAKKVTSPQRRLATKSELAGVSVSSVPVSTEPAVKTVAPPQRKLASDSELAGSSVSSVPVSAGPVLKKVTPKRGPKKASLVQTVFTKLAAKEDDDEVKRKRSFNVVAAPVESAETKRVKPDSAAVIDLT